MCRRRRHHVTVGQLLNHTKCSFQHPAITVAKREVSIEKTEILAIPITQEQIAGEQFSERLLGEYSVLFKRLIGFSDRGAEAITGPQDELLVGNVIDVYSDLRFKGLSIENSPSSTDLLSVPIKKSLTFGFCFRLV